MDIQSLFYSIQDKVKFFLAKDRFDTNARLVMYEKLGSALSEGITILDIVSDLHKRYVRRKNPISYMTGKWISKIKKGENFSEAIKGWAPEGDIYLLAAGEERNNLEESFSELIRITNEQKKLKKLVSSDIYPQFFTLAVLLGVIYGFSSYIAPQFKDLISEDKWPPVAIYYFAFSDAVLNYFAYIAAAMVLLIGLSAWSFKNLTGPLRTRLDKFPPWTIYKEMESANLLIVISGMVKSGIAVNDAITKIEKFSPKYTSFHLRTMKRRLAAGINEGEAMNTGMLPQDLADDVIDYGKRAGFSKGILSIGRRAGDEVVEKIGNNISKIGKLVNYSIYGYASFAIMSISGLVDAMMKQF